MFRREPISPLFDLIVKKRWEEVTNLIAKGGDVNVRSEYRILRRTLELTPLQASLEAERWIHLVVPADIIRLLVSTDNVNMQCADGWTPLHFAVHYKRWELVPIFLEKGADVNIHDDWYDTALETALIQKEAEPNIIALLISPQNVHNVRIPIMIRFAEPFLRGFLPNWNPQVLSLLVENGVNLSIVDSYGNTPLHIAVRDLHNMEIITLLISTRNINARNLDGQTPLMIIDEKIEKSSPIFLSLRCFIKSDSMKDLLRMIPIFLGRGADPYVLPAHKLPPKPFSLIHFCVISIRRQTSNNAYNRLPLPPKLQRRVEFEDLAQHIVDYYLRVVEAKIGIRWKL